MKRISISIFFILLFIFKNQSVYGQLSGNSLMEYQLGNIPDVDPPDLSTLYNQFNLQYRYKELKTSVRIEHFYSTDSIDRDYISLSQWYLNYKWKKIELRAGNFFETLGRGLVFRSFEIPSSIKEERIFRVRHGFYRDIQGVSFNYKGEIFRLKVLYGKPLQLTFPPGHENQRQETIEALQPEFKVLNQNLGFIVMRHSRLGTHTLYNSIFIQGNLPLNFAYYGEYARNMSENPNPLQFKDGDGIAVYLSLNQSFENIGWSLELKKYQNFQIGTGITDPPTLVREHYYHLLNRSIHVPELENESGYQFEAYFTFEDGKMLTLNTARAKNQFLEKYIFNEYFIEYYWPYSNNNFTKLFFDFSRDDLKLEDQRYTTGIYHTQYIKNSWSASIESEFQAINREFNNSNPIYNTYLSIGINKSTSLGFSVYYEYTTDGIVADRSGTIKREKDRHFYGLGFTCRPNFRNTFTLFAGERQGGPACTSGVCYEVLDFSGFEIRWTLKF